MKLHAVLKVKKRLLELGWDVFLKHQDEQNPLTHWWLNSNIPYITRSWPRYQGGVIVGWSYGTEYKEWKVTFNRLGDFRNFLKRYYKHHVNFWDWEQLEEDIVYESDNIHYIVPGLPKYWCSGCYKQIKYPVRRERNDFCTFKCYCDWVEMIKNNVDSN